MDVGGPLLISIGEGGTGEVYSLTGSMACIKLIPRGYQSENETNLEAFYWSVSRGTPAGAVTLPSGDMMLFMPRDHGTSLANLPYLALPESAFDGALAALKRLHDSGVVHGDVAERNLVFCAPETVTLVDFGCCEPLRHGDRAREVRRLALMCSYHTGEYADAPEGGYSEDLPRLDEITASLERKYGALPECSPARLNAPPAPHDSRADGAARTYSPRSPAMIVACRGGVHRIADTPLHFRFGGDASLLREQAAAFDGRSAVAVFPSGEAFAVFDDHPLTRKRARG
jgi:serine/threonine protein kinase